MKKFIITLALLASLSLGAQAQQKIGIIDLRKVFDNYYKTKQADASLKDEANDLDKQGKGLLEDLKKGQEEYQKMAEKSNDQAVSSDERARNKQSADKKLAELRELDQTVKQFERSARTKLSEKQKRLREKIIGEIRETVNSKAKAAGYSIVLDTAAESNNNTPVIMYTTGENDLTDAVLAQLNATAPATTPKTDAPAPAPASTPKSGK